MTDPYTRGYANGALNVEQRILILLAEWDQEVETLKTIARLTKDADEARQSKVIAADLSQRIDGLRQVLNASPTDGGG